MNLDELRKTLKLHSLWLSGAPEGVRADLRGADLSDINLSGTDLRGADLSGTNLRGADLSCASLSCADLSCASLRGANLRDADFRGANLSGTNLLDADLAVLLTDVWTVYIHPEHIRIGCQYHGADKWFAFSDKQIGEMENRALEWWKKWREIIKTIHQTIKSKAGE